ncbi:MAG: hypothetical protein ACUVUC_09875 [Thermoguttaceae bacterium]
MGDFFWLEAMVDWSLNPVGGSYLVVAAWAIVLLALMALAPSTVRVGRARRWALAALRLAVILLVVLAMLRPTLVYTETRKRSATLVLLIDKSRSMSVRDEANDRTRLEALAAALAASRDALRRLAADFELKAYSFDAELRPVELADGQVRFDQTPDGQQTAIGYALEGVLRQEAGKHLRGIVLLSDGAQRAYPPRHTQPEAVARHMRYLGVPLLAVRFGQSRALAQTQDVQVTELLADPAVFVKNRLLVRAQVRINGFVNRRIPVELLAETSPGKMEVVDRKQVELKPDGLLYEIGPDGSSRRVELLELAYVPERPGEWKLTLEAAPQAGELSTKNNRLSTFVNVRKGGVRVLYLEGPWRIEQKFLAVYSLGASPDINVDVRNLNLRGPQTWHEELAELFRPGKCDVYILGDIDSTAFSRQELADLAEAVRKGAGLIMLGGVQSFGPGGYADTPLADVLPVRMETLERQPPGGPVSRDLHLPGPLRMRPTRIGLEATNLMLASTRDQSAQVWERLPPLDGANKLLGPRPGDLVLAADPEGRPLLISGQRGAGRVIAFAADSTWRWWMHGMESAHKRFWRQTILWLARKDESAEGNVWVQLAPRRFHPAQRVEFTLGAQDPAGQPIQGVTFTAEVQRPDGSTTPLLETRSDGPVSSSFRETERPGDYAIRMTARQQDKPLGSAQARFVVTEQDLELDDPHADEALLNELVALSRPPEVPADQRWSVLPGELPELLERLGQGAEDLEEKHELSSRICHTWPFFLALVGLLGLEWYLRKRWGLV